MSNKRIPGRNVPTCAALCLAVLGLFLATARLSIAAEAAPKKIVLLAGTVHQGPGGHPAGTHEYELTARLLKSSLAAAAPAAIVEIHFDGWPSDAKTLDDADTIVVISDGADRNPADHPLLVGDRLDVLRKQMDRGCGLIAIHWSTFVPNDRGGPEFLQWIGGYFDYQAGTGESPWFSKIQTAETKPHPASPDHPISRGLKPFDLREEYYYNIRFAASEPVVPILSTPIPGEDREQVVAWARERGNGGRGFGFTGGHFFENWGIPDFRRMVLNAILWTAHIEVPRDGAQSAAPRPVDPPVSADDKRIQAVIVTGHQHPAHLWRETTPALQEALAQDKRMQITVVTDPEFLASENLHGYDVVVLNYCNWQRPGLSDAAKANFQKYLNDGGGLALIHFANGAFHSSLPETPPSDWPEYRNICRRIWDHAPGKSSHDAFGQFKVHVTENHPITAGLNSFETIDELYCNQQGEGPIEVLATARSVVTGRDEPLAFVYPYGKGRIFQTVLGHAAESIRNPGTAALIRRGTIWAADKPQRAVSAAMPPARTNPPKLAAAGKFDAALDARAGGAAWAEHKPAYVARPLTVECWAKLDGKTGFNILAASTSKDSADHWELYTYAGSGELSLYMPGCAPAEVKSGVDVVDGQWHYLAAAFDDSQVKLFVDGKLVHEASIARLRSGGPIAALHFGGYPPHNIGCDGLVDEVRISSTLRNIDSLPTAPFTASADTIGLWHFDRLDADRVEDDSPLKNAALSGSRGTIVAPLLARRTADPALRLTSVDISPDESFLSLRTDTTGRLFAGGREGLFVYEPEAAGGYAPRQLLYRFPPDTWVTDVEIRGDDLYVMTNAALYRIAGGRVQRESLVPQRLLWGSPVDLHVTWHGLAWGPEGDLYFSSGDPLLNYGDFQKRPDHFGHWTIYGPNEQTAYTGVGGFYRCKPDGSGLRVVAGGARGAVGIAFDRRWNLFSNDNDHESIADRYSPARLLHVAPQANFFWPRGWIAEMSPERSDLLDVVNSGMGREAPVGQAYLDEPSLGEKYTDSVVVARWGQRRVSGYKLTPRGASFAGEEYPLLIGDDIARPVGVTVGRGGRVFVSLSYMAANEWSPKYPSEIVMLSRADDAGRQPFDPYDAPTAEPARLWSELSSDSSQRRQQAQVELMRRGGKLLDEAIGRLMRSSPEDPARIPLIWLSAASGTAHARAALQSLATSDNANLRATVVRAQHEFPALGADPATFARALTDGDDAVRHAAVVALFDSSEPLPAGLFAGPAREGDSYLRQATAMLIARRGTSQQIQQLLSSNDAAQRLSGVLAAGFRLTVPPAIGALPPELPLKYESGNAEFVIQYADAKIDLKSLGRVGSFTTAERWKHVPPSDEEKLLYQALLERLADTDERVFQQAAYFLNLFDVPQANEAVAKTRRERLLKRLAAAPVNAVNEAWSIGPFDDRASGFETVHPPERGPIDLSANLSAGTNSLAWEVAGGGKSVYSATPSSAPQSSYAYFRLQSLQPQPAQLDITAPAGYKLWHNGRPVELAQPLILTLDPGSNDILLRVAHAAKASRLTVNVRAVDRVEATLPERLALGTLAERLRNTSGDATQVPVEFLAVDWSVAAQAGDAERGRRLFGVDALGCVKCHAVLPNQKGGGAPSLAGASKRFTVSHLVESVLAPGKQVAPVFGTTTIVTADGQSLSGLVVEENDERVVLLLPTAVRQEVAKGDIEARKLQNASPMPSGLVKTPAELSDLLAYLLGENPQAP